MLHDPIALDRQKLDRIDNIETERFITYPKAASHLALFERLLTTPRPRHYLLTALSGNGKTTLAEYFRAKHPCRINPEGEAAILPVLRVTCPPKSSIGSFADALLKAMMQKYPKGMVAAEKIDVAINLMRTLSVRVLFVDEVQHVNVGSVHERSGMRNTFKMIADQSGASVVLMGIASAVSIVSKEPQLSRRFKPLVLPKWKADDIGRSLIQKIETDLGLKHASNIAQNVALCRKIFAKTNGVLESVVLLMQDAGIEAIDSGKERIDEKLIDGLDWHSNDHSYAKAAKMLGCDETEVGRLAA